MTKDEILEKIVLLEERHMRNGGVISEGSLDFLTTQLRSALREIQALREEIERLKGFILGLGG